MQNNNQIALDVALAEKYGLEEAILIGAISDSSFMKARGQLSGFSQTATFDYPWDVRKIDGRIWYSFSDADLEVLLPIWEPAHTKEVLLRLVEKGLLDTQEGSSGTHYSLKSG